MKLFFTLILLMSSLFGFSQKWQKLESELKKIEENRTKAFSQAEKNNWIIRDTTGGKVTILNGISNTGMPLYLTTYNLASAETIGTYQVHDGGTAGLSLTGEGINIGLWDGGSVLANHQEFDGRLVNVGDSPKMYHSTHVAGTMIAKGLKSEAKGMAPGAEITGFDMARNIEEMTSAAKIGMVLSNHSYGTTAGWTFNNQNASWYWHGDVSVSDKGDYKFGFYDNSTSAWDRLAATEPMTLMVKASGNNRGNGQGVQEGEFYYFDHDQGAYIKPVSGVMPFPVDGPYDCIPTESVAKNILTVGAVNKVVDYVDPSSVELAYFSATGPTDDGRIKPDVVACGVDVYSCRDRGTRDYGYYSGTSMASPAVTGSVALLQEHYMNLFDSKMRSSLAKAVVIHTAKECGETPGPDYMFGWGLMDTKAAADVISGKNSTIIELDITEPVEFYVTASGDQALKATMVWTDPAHKGMEPELNNRTPMLINDMDLRIVGEETHYPWKLDVENPELAAVKGDNLVDNVEQVVIDEPLANQYKITVGYKGDLPGKQTVSIVITGVSEELITSNAVGLGMVELGSVAEGSFAITNQNETPISINSINTSDNVSITDNVQQLAPNETQEVSFTCEINKAGHIDQLITINYGNNKVKTIFVNGFVSAYKLESESNIDFGTVEYRRSNIKNLTLINSGNKTVNISEIILPDDFTITPESASVPMGGSKSFSIRYTPNAGAVINEPIRLVIDGEEVEVSNITARCDYIPTGIEEIENGSIKIYPNPIKQGDYIHLDFASEKANMIQIYSLLGRKIFEQEVSNTNTIPTGNFPKGLLLVNIIYENKVVTTKLMIL